MKSNVKPETAMEIDFYGKTYKTRAWYMAASSERHRAYYAQFDKPAVRALLQSAFGPRFPRIVRAYMQGDKFFNEVTKLSEWDRLDDSFRRLCGRLVTRLEYHNVPAGIVYWSPSNTTSIGKEALRNMVEEYLERCKTFSNPSPEVSRQDTQENAE